MITNKQLKASDQCKKNNIDIFNIFIVGQFAGQGEDYVSDSCFRVARRKSANLRERLPSGLLAGMFHSVHARTKSSLDGPQRLDFVN